MDMNIILHPHPSLDGIIANQRFWYEMLMCVILNSLTAQASAC